MDTLLPNTVLSPYRIISKIGAGGMGEVYLAQDTSELGRTVALKIVSAEVAKDKGRLQGFTQEARTVSNLNHPNILTIHEFGQTESISFIATEFVDGVTLREHQSHQPEGFSSSMAAIFFAQLGEKDKAFVELNKAIENREYTVRFLRIEPGFDPLRDDPRFKELMQRMKFPE